jgi:hypothetical protein
LILFELHRDDEGAGSEGGIPARNLDLGDIVMVVNACNRAAVRVEIVRFIVRGDGDDVVLVDRLEGATNSGLDRQGGAPFVFEGDSLEFDTARRVSRGRW